ncbi:MAG: hypothetical protein KatS3mg105_3328 [Gemmatales bacterium]|nr:MAG: hypothetical protein KatS3mg105_3328 [Gemmatales bacterium]
MRILSVSCSQCGHTLRVKPELAGRTGKCPKCQNPITIPLEEHLPDQMRPRAVQPIVTSASPPAATRPCPFCAETILAEARKCKHCGEILDPDLRAALAATQPAAATAPIQVNIQNESIGGGAQAIAEAKARSRSSILFRPIGGANGCLLVLLLPFLLFLFCGMLGYLNPHSPRSRLDDGEEVPVAKPVPDSQTPDLPEKSAIKTTQPEEQAKPQVKPRAPAANLDVKKRFADCKKYFESVRMHFREVQEARKKGLSRTEWASLRRRIHDLRQRVGRAFSYSDGKPDFQPEWWISVAAGDLENAAQERTPKLDGLVAEDLQRAEKALKKLEEQKKLAYPFE